MTRWQVPVFPSCAGRGSCCFHTCPARPAQMATLALLPTAAVGLRVDQQTECCMGRRLMGPESPFSPTPQSLSSFPLSLSGSSQKHFHPFHQTSQPSPSQRVLPPHPSTPSTSHWIAGGEKLTSPRHILVLNPHLTSGSDPKAKRPHRAERRENRE